MSGINKENQQPSVSSRGGSPSRARLLLGNFQTQTTNGPGATTGKRRRYEASDGGDSALTSGPRKRQSKTDPLVHHGRHFGRTIQTFCRIQTLIQNGLARTIQFELGRLSEGELSDEEKREHRIYTQLLALSPTLEERLCTTTEQDLFYIAEMITRGASSARSDDTKSIKSAIVDWITPTNGTLKPPLLRNVKTDRGFHHPRTGELLCPTNLDWSDPSIREALRTGAIVPSGDLWPRFLFRNFQPNPDNLWDGLFRSGLLVKAFKHIFTSPSSVYNDAPRSTRSSNARIHGMKSVTIPSIAYVATLVKFSLSSSAVFSRTDLVTDSEYFYNLIIEFLEDEEEEEEVKSLLAWWDQQVFPRQLLDSRSIHKDSVIAKIKERRRKVLAQKEINSALQAGRDVQNDQEDEDPPALQTIANSVLNQSQNNGDGHGHDQEELEAPGS
ncbi:hypothetical protein CC2G_011082 [Coprinopsis cinerea AmutBmut pab1-1]|nr:hypothetical protein CC2G_011073 [Coprinopsis cinerea AmutBmut pab1-1]KAG2014247.1 hypothetical protein CC2G_011082 [Coprinopsis cinerea AmutBmut pab1-1]